MNNQINVTEQQFAPAGAHKKYRSGICSGIAILIVMTVMASCKGNNSASQSSAQAADSSAVIRDSLQSQYNAAKIQVDGLATKNAVLDSQIMQKDKEIAMLKGKLKHEIRSNKALAAELKKDKSLIGSLRDELSDKAKSFADRISQLEAERDNLSHQRDSLTTKYNSLKELGSVLHASNIRLMALHLKHHGKKEKKTERARKADVLRVYFDIDENRIAEDGTKMLYLTIKDPQGHLLTDAGSGTTNSSAGTQLQYSILKQIPLKQNESVKDVTVDWKQEGDYQKGVYSITIYNGGYKIGGGDVTLN